MIPEAILNQIQDRLDIVEVIAAHLPLRRSGKNFKANCPFHQEKTPSFMVNPDKQIFHCFGCGAGGNVFGFLMKFEKKDFREVVESLANSVGVQLPKDSSQSTENLERYAMHLKANELAMNHYHQFLLSNPKAQIAREYLEKRGVSESTIKEFKIGFSPSTWDWLGNTLKSEISQGVLEKTGLLIAKKEGGAYDRFRNRVMFPILDAKGHCVAFGGRVLDDSLPKYLNSPETEIYSKGKILYGFHQARKAIRECDAAIIVEGYMDLIACFQAGIKNVVASCGTALTVDQAKLLKRNTSNIIILYDADKAGEMATLRGLEIFLEEGLEAKIVRLPEGYDPDSFIKELGPEGFNVELKRSKTIFQFKLELLKSKHGVQSIESKIKIADEMIGLINKVQNEILKAEWVKELARGLDLSTEAISAQMTKIRKDPRLAEPVSVVAQNTSSVKEPSILERLIVGLLLEDKALAQSLMEDLRQTDLEHPAAQRVVKKIFEAQTISVSQLMNCFNEDAQAIKIILTATAELACAVDKKKTLSDCILKIKLGRLKNERDGLRAQIIAAENEGNQTLIHQLLNDLNELNKKGKQINEKK